MSSRLKDDRFVLRTGDGVRLDAVHVPARTDSRTAIVVAHGFSGTWRSPRTRNIATALSRRAGVLAFDFRGHGRSGATSTVGDLEVFDIAAAVTAARARGYERVAVAGFSMGASVAVRHAALHGGVDAVASISGPAHWYYRGTPRMRMLHRAVELRTGRLFSRLALRTRIASQGWDPVPVTPTECAHKIAPTPFLVVHGDRDRYFPLRHAHALYDAATDPRELWILPGFGHAESGMTPELVNRLGEWLCDAAATDGVSPTP